MRLLKSILIEGPDGTGKTQIHDLMVEDWGFRTSGHDGGPPADAADGWQRLAMYAAQFPCIRDRSPCISDIMYSEALSRSTVISEDDYKTYLKELCPIIIYCRPPTAVIMSNEIKVRAHKPRLFVDKVIEQRDRILRAYDGVLPALMDECELDGYLYDWTTDPKATRLLDWLKTEVKACAE